MFDWFRLDYFVWFACGTIFLRIVYLAAKSLGL
jgi:hypothetical protein